MEYKISDFLKSDDEVSMSELYINIKNNSLYKSQKWTKIDDNLFCIYYYNATTSKMYYATPVVYDNELIGIKIDYKEIPKDEILSRLAMTMRPYKLKKLKDRINGKYREFGTNGINTERVL